MVTDKVRAYVEAHAAEGRKLLMDLARIPAPSHHEEKRAEFCRAWLEGRGAKGVYIDDALNVVYPVGVTADSPVVVFMAHMDVVFPDVEELPLTARDGKLFCPGIGDNTANLAALLLAAGYAAETGAEPADWGVVFVCGSCEEGLGNLKGSRQICRQYGSRIKAFYALDVYMSSYTNRAVGSIRFRVKVSAEGGHSYWDFGRENAIAKLAGLIQELYRLLVPESGKTTFNVGTISGGTSVNTIAQNAEMTYEIRSDCMDSIKKMEAMFYEMVERQKTPGTEITVEVIGNRPCEGAVDETARRKLFDQVIHAIMDAGGRTPVGKPGSTDCNIPLSMGIPAVCFGTCEGKGFHTREEFIWEDSLMPGYLAAFEVVTSYF